MFRREEITADVVMASAALPLVFQAVEIDGEPYWDGGFTGNPAILPLISANKVDDVLVVQIAPLIRDTTPTSTRDILHRVSEITFNSSLATELRALEYFGREAGDTTACASTCIASRSKVSSESSRGNSRLNTDYDYFALLHRAGLRAGRLFLDNHYDDIGRRSTADLAAAAEAESA